MVVKYGALLLLGINMSVTPLSLRSHSCRYEAMPNIAFENIAFEKILYGEY
jgi:hypothetical protein